MRKINVKVRESGILTASGLDIDLIVNQKNESVEAFKIRGSTQA